MARRSEETLSWQTSALEVAPSASRWQSSVVHRAHQALCWSVLFHINAFLIAHSVRPLLLLLSLPCQIYHSENQPIKLSAPSSCGVSATDSETVIWFAFLVLPVAPRDQFTAGLMHETNASSQVKDAGTVPRASPVCGDQRGGGPFYSSCLKAVSGRATVARTNVAAVLLINSPESWE